MTAEISKNKFVVRTFLEAFGRGDIDACIALCAKDYAWHLYDSPDGPVTLDLAAFRASLGSFRRSLPDCSVEILDLVAEHDRVAVRLRQYGHHTGQPWQGAEATAAFVEWFPFVVYRVEDGRLVEEWSAPISWAISR